MKQNTLSGTNPLIGIRRADKEIQIEYQYVGSGPSGSPLIIFLHEGLGSISMWRDWPEQVCTALDCRGLVYSRYGYGQSTARQPGEARSNDYLHREARDDLPALLRALRLADERPILYGHSDGGSIALLYAAMHPDKVHGIAVAAPHIFVEDITIKGIQEARTLYHTTDLAVRLGRHHRDPDSVFWSWNDAWLAPEFRRWNIEASVPDIRCPILAIQGENDEYGTLEQIRGIQRLAPQAELCVIPDCGHSPHRDQPGTVTRSLADFIQRRSMDFQ